MRSRPNGVSVITTTYDAGHDGPEQQPPGRWVGAHTPRREQRGRSEGERGRDERGEHRRGRDGYVELHHEGVILVRPQQVLGVVLATDQLGMIEAHVGQPDRVHHQREPVEQGNHELERRDHS